MESVEMARRKTGDGGSTTSKMTVMVFQLEGDDATLQEGIRTISGALNRVLPGNVVHTAIAAPHFTPGLPAPDVIEDANGEFVDVEPAVNGSSNGNRKRTNSVKSPQVLDLDLKQGKISLTDFLSKHAVDQVNKRYLLIAYWLKHHAEIEEVTMDHIHTGYRHMGWQTPKAAAQPLRDMKSKLGWFHKGESKGCYKINHVGENEVMNIMKENE
jgi:hypothetical protein